MWLELKTVHDKPMHSQNQDKISKKQIMTSKYFTYYYYRGEHKLLHSIFIKPFYYLLM